MKGLLGLHFRRDSKARRALKL